MNMLPLRMTGRIISGQIPAKEVSRPQNKLAQKKVRFLIKPDFCFISSDTNQTKN
jgi:hypothetical protein